MRCSWPGRSGWGRGGPATRPSIARVALRLLIVLAAATAVWPTLEPAYDRAVAAVALRVLHAVERTQRIAGVRFEGDRAVVVRTPGTELGDQRLELRTHHNNVPLLVALMLLAPGAAWGRRAGRLLAALALLALTHVAHFVLAVHFEYALANVGIYHVDDLNVLFQPPWRRVQNLAELRKTVVVGLYEFQAHVGRLLMPVLLWMLLAPDRREVGVPVARMRRGSRVAPRCPPRRSSSLLREEEAGLARGRDD